jgi:outer membrane assembly lipoprotein YfiO
VIKTRKHIILSIFLIINSIIFCTENIKPVFDVNIPKDEESASSADNSKKDKSKKIRTYMDMEYDQLVEAKNVQKANGNTSATIKYLEQLLKITTDVTQIAEHLLELADTFFEDKQYTKATFIYNQFCALYPGSEKQEYALYKSIMSSFACILPIDRDQSKTEETLILTEFFLKQDHFSTYKEEVTTVRKQCQEHLASSELSICTFYINKGSLKAAEKRLSKVRSVWLPKLPTLEPEIIAFETQIADKRAIAEALQNKNTELAQNSKKHMANRF